jgi:TRAP-type C4-dicarboxylate transport system permease small subunit
MSEFLLLLLFCFILVWFGFMMFNATFNTISVILWQSVILVEETRGPGENHRPVATH